MRRRPSSRLLVLDRAGRVLLFRFVYSEPAVGRQEHWATPGGALEPGEIFEDAARRELFEETGIVAQEVAEPVAGTEFILQLLSGERVVAEERFFVVRIDEPAPIVQDRWTPVEREVMVEHRWWSAGDLSLTNERFYPEDLIDVLASLGVGVHGDTHDRSFT